MGLLRGWHEDRATPWPWLRYLVDVPAQAYRIFGRRAASERATGTKQDRVRDHVLNQSPPVFRVAGIRAALPGVSDPTIRPVLQQLRQDGLVEPDGVGRSALWRRRGGGAGEPASG